MIYYAVDATGQHFWITATGLPAPVSPDVVMIEDVRNGGVLVMKAELEPPSPAVAPAKTNVKNIK
jgi:hypothetical protein